jgi:hypothetical protein
LENFTEQYFTRFYTYFLLIFTIHIINIMSQRHEQQQERSQLKVEEPNQGSLSSNKACQSCSEEFGAIIQHWAKTHCKRGAGGARTKAISQHPTASSSKREAGGARTKARTRATS